MRWTGLFKKFSAISYLDACMCSVLGTQNLLYFKKVHSNGTRAHAAPRIRVVFGSDELGYRVMHDVDFEYLSLRDGFKWSIIY